MKNNIADFNQSVVGACADLLKTYRFERSLPEFEIVPATRVIPEGRKAVFCSQFGVALEMGFFPFGDGEMIILVYVRSIHHREPINLDDWRKIHVPGFTESPFRIRSLIPLGDAVLRVTEAMSTILRHSAMEMILNGDTWEDIPFDWTGIK
jgi:hypothetical protein